MTKERLERIKENVHVRCSIAITSRIGLTAPDKEELVLIDEIERLYNIIDKVEDILLVGLGDKVINNYIDKKDRNRLEWYLNEIKQIRK